MCAGPFLLQALYGEVCGFSTLAPPLAGVSFSSVKSSRLLLSCRFTLSFGPSSTPFGCLPLARLFALLLGPLRCFSSPATFLIVRIAPFDSAPLACQDGSLLCGLSDGHPYWRASGALPLFFPASEVTPVSFVFTFVAKCESLLVPSLAPSWLYLCPTLRLVSTYVLCFAQFVPSAFSWTGRLPCSVALAVFLSLRAARLGSFCGCGFVPPPGGVPSAGAARLEVSPIRTHEFSGISTSVAFLSDGHLLCFFSLCFLCFFVLCVSQPKKSRGVGLYGHMKCRGSWIPPEFLLAPSGTLSLSFDL